MHRPAVAAVLAFLVPGSGHFYQGRFLKGFIYSICILGTFLGGMALGDWHPVYCRKDNQHTHFGYVSQFMVGLPAMPALIQNSRFKHQNEGLAPGWGGIDLDVGVDDEFEGEYHTAGVTKSIRGTLSLTLADTNLGPELRGEFRGVDSRANPVALRISGVLEAGLKVYPSKRRALRCGVVDSNSQRIGRIDGSIPRPFLDWFEVPLDDETLERLHGDLGKQFDMAVVYTWIAGLLNVLAIWDALEGPAYGYGDEDDAEGDESSGDGKSAA